MSKPIVFNYGDYEKVVEENKKLKEDIANLQIRCRIAESEKPVSFDRDCKSCKHQKADGCSRWECEYEPRMDDLISRADAIEAIASRDETDGTVKAFTGREVNEILSALPSADAVQIPIKLEKRYPQSRDEDITDAFMRGYLAGRSSVDRQGVVRCKDCKYFEYNHTEVVDGVPLILAHEICAFWGGGSKTSENGYCSFGERKEQSDE